MNIYRKNAFFFIFLGSSALKLSKRFLSNSEEIGFFYYDPEEEISAFH